MSAVLTTGHGGYEVLEFSNDVKVPQPNFDQVLIKVLGAGINNTDINTRTAWYSKSVKGETNAQESKGKGDDGSWSGEPLDFPIIQGADCYGEIVAVGPGKTSDAGNLVKMTLKTGDVVLYGKYSGTEIVHEGKELLIMKETDILAVL